MSNEYFFVTRWAVDAAPAEVYAILMDFEALPVWWPAVYLDVRLLQRGAPGDEGTTAALHTKGWLPYTLKWSLEVTTVDPPRGFSLAARGDFVGSGVWRIEAEPGGERCTVTYEWRINAEKPLLRHLGWLLRPVFAANHHWAMRAGEISLNMEIRRRRAGSEAERQALPRPPGPTFPHNLGQRRRSRCGPRAEPRAGARRGAQGVITTATTVGS